MGSGVKKGGMRNSVCNWSGERLASKGGATL
jgi:hypothetical protein